MGSATPTPPATAPAQLPTNASDYADALVRAWGVGARASAGHYAQPHAVHQLFSHADPGGSQWRRTTSEGAAGTIYVSYHNDANGQRLTLAVTNMRAGQGKPHAVRGARFS
ncbi:MAG: hypothetical protein ACRDQA_19405 [Nocardioidaceae bacterium]